MHEAEGRAQGLSYVYTLLDTETMGEDAPAIGRAHRFCRAFRLHGLQRHVSLQAGNHPAARRAFRGGRDPRLGQHRRAAGAAGASATTPTCGASGRAFAAGMAGAKRAAVLLLGAGGAGAAVAHALLESGVERLLVADIQADRAAALASRLLAARRHAPGRGRIGPRRGRQSRRRHRQRDAGRHGKAAGHADRRRSAAARVLGRRHRLFPAGNGAAQRGTAAGLPHARAAKAWPSSRPCGPSNSSPGMAPDVERMKAAFAAFAKRQPAERSTAGGTPDEDLGKANREEEHDFQCHTPPVPGRQPALLATAAAFPALRSGQAEAALLGGVLRAGHPRRDDEECSPTPSRTTSSSRAITAATCSSRAPSSSPSSAAISRWATSRRRTSPSRSRPGRSSPPAISSATPRISRRSSPAISAPS